SIRSRRARYIRNRGSASRNTGPWDWSRRTVSQSQRVVADRDALSTMLVGGVADGFDLAEVGRMFSRITEAHTKRMAALGLAA
ncbi:hypothetical protein ABT086_37040, partial [Streptomyces mirabilis]